MSTSPQGATMLPRQGSRREPSPAGSSSRNLRRNAGHSLIDLLVVISIMIITLAAAIPLTQSMVHESRLRGAAFYLRGLVREIRSRSAAEARYVGIVFDEVAGDPVFSVYADGNFNGIRRSDIAQGIDVRLREPYRLSETFPGVKYGHLPLGAKEPFFPALQIGRSHILSFSPLGSSTSGTLYLSNDRGLVYAVVILGSTGRVRIARYRGGGRWQAV